MHIAILLLFLCHHLINANAFKLCCEGVNVIENGTCLEGYNITHLDCDTKVLTGPTQVKPIKFEIDEDDMLHINEENGHIIIQPEKYCITKKSENDTDDLVLMCVEDEDELPDNTTVTLFYIKACCAFITVLFLLMVLIIYIFLPDLRDIEGICILNFTGTLCASMLLISFLPIIVAFLQHKLCDFTAFLYYTGTLCCINWLSIMSFHLWRLTIRPIFEPHINWCKVYFCYGYGLPLLLLLTAILLHFSHDSAIRVAESACIFAGNAAVWAYFYGPVMIMLLISIILQLWAAKKLWVGYDSRDHLQDLHHLRKKSLIYMHLLLVVGLGQTLDMISYAVVQNDDYLMIMWDINDCRNLLIGGIIFLILVALRNKVLKALAKRGLFCMKFPKSWEKLRDEENEEVEYEEAVLTRHSTGF